MSLKYQVFSAVRWTTAASGVRTLIQLAQVALLARLLTPADYGLMAMVAVVLGFSSILSDMGVSSAYVQRQYVTERERSSLFWLNVILSGVLTLLLVTLSPVVANWFSDERLTPLLMLSSSIFIISALGQQVRINAEKALNFRPLVVLEVGASLLGFAAAVITAVAGWGVYALIMGAIVTAFSSTVLAWLCLADGWRPLWRFQLIEIRSYLGFGGSLVANNLVNEVNRSIDLLLGGRMLGAVALGLYSLPRQLVFQIQGIVNPVVTRVGFPLIAQVQTDIIQVRSIYLKILNMTAAVNAPLYVGIAFFSPEVISIVLGNQWLAAVDLLSLLAIWGGLRSTGNPVGSLLLGMGRADLSLKWNLAMLLIVPPVLWGGAQFGTLGLAWALLGFSVVMFVPGWYILVRPLCKVGLVEYTLVTLRPFLLAVVSVVPAYGVANQFDGAVARLIVGVLVAAPLYLVVSYKANREWFDAMQRLVRFGA
ncbi:MAG: MOP flippase family protein [Motiliproteus sp.]